MTTDTDLRPFRIEIPQADLDDLQDRLARTRLPRPAPTDSWDLGTPNSYLAETVAHWKDAFDWREHEARLNAFPQFVTDIDGQTVHFVHVPSQSSRSHVTIAPMLIAARNARFVVMLAWNAFTMSPSPFSAWLKVPTVVGMASPVFQRKMPRSLFASNRTA